MTSLNIGLQPAETPFYDAGKMRLLLALRQQGITDVAVLSALESIPRESFLPTHMASKAYDDVVLPIAQSQTISQPSVVAWMTWALSVQKQHKVLEIGTGSGYQAAVLSKLCRRVYTIERHRELYQTAEARFRELGLRNITAQMGDGTKGWKQAAPFDRIMVTAAAGTVPSELLEQLAVGGVMVVPVGSQAADQILLRITRTEEGFKTDHLMNVRFVPLVEGKVPGQ